MAPTNTSLVFCIVLFTALSAVLYWHIPEHPRAHQDVDSSAYLEKAIALQQTGSLVPAGTPPPYYTIGYAAIIGTLFQFCNGSYIPSIIVMQIMLSCLIILLAYALGTLIFGPCAGLIAAALASVNVGLLTFAQFVLTETVLTFFLTCFLYALAYGLLRHWQPAYLFAGLALGCSVTIKPAALYFLLLLLPLLLGAWAFKQRPGLQAIMFLLIGYLIPPGIYMGAWRYHHGIWHLSKMDSMNLTVWFYPYVRASLYNTDVQAERALLSARYAQPGGPQAMQAEVQAIIQQHPLLCARLWLFNIAKTWFGLFASNLKILADPTLSSGFGVSYFSTQGSILMRATTYIQRGCQSTFIALLAWYEAVWSIVRIPLIALGLYMLYLHYGWYGLLLMLSYLAYFSSITGHDGCARFRMMFEIPLVLLAASGICFLLKTQRKTKTS